MFIDKDSIMIDGISIGQYCVQATYSYNKLWSSDSGRNLAGSQVGTLIGIFPKIQLQFRRLSKSELNVISKILDSGSQQVTYYDPNINEKVTMETYSGDWELVNKGIMNNEGFSCSFIAKKKRG